MKPQFEILDRMDQIVVHIRTQYGRSPNECETQTIVLDEHSATELCLAIGKALRARRTSVKPAPKEAPMRWYQIRARAHERRGPREVYGFGRTEEEAHRNSEFRNLHSGEVTIVKMPDDFVPTGAK